jgi:hypothetical protein
MLWSIFGVSSVRKTNLPEQVSTAAEAYEEDFIFYGGSAMLMAGYLGCPCFLQENTKHNKTGYDYLMQNPYLVNIRDHLPT